MIIAWVLVWPYVGGYMTGPYVISLMNITLCKWNESGTNRARKIDCVITVLKVKWPHT